MLKSIFLQKSCQNLLSLSTLLSNLNILFPLANLDLTLIVLVIYWGVPTLGKKL